jgi:hypothetical protein
MFNAMVRIKALCKFIPGETPEKAASNLVVKLNGGDSISPATAR